MRFSLSGHDLIRLASELEPEFRDPAEEAFIAALRGGVEPLRLLRRACGSQAAVMRDAIDARAGRRRAA